jgi:hypothetical protein
MFVRAGSLGLYRWMDPLDDIYGMKHHSCPIFRIIVKVVEELEEFYLFYP